jgi:hypothetical protein
VLRVTLYFRPINRWILLDLRGGLGHRKKLTSGQTITAPPSRDAARSLPHKARISVV